METIAGRPFKRCGHTMEDDEKAFTRMNCIACTWTAAIQFQALFIHYLKMKRLGVSIIPLEELEPFFQEEIEKTKRLTRV